MDNYKRVEQSKILPQKNREIQELMKVTPKGEHEYYPFKSLQKRANGEYYASREDRINVILIFVNLNLI